MICYGLVDWLIRYPMTAVVTVVFTSCPTRGGQQRNQFRLRCRFLEVRVIQTLFVMEYSFYSFIILAWSPYFPVFCYFFRSRHLPSVHSSIVFMTFKLILGTLANHLKVQLRNMSTAHLTSLELAILKSCHQIVKLIYKLLRSDHHWKYSSLNKKITRQYSWLNKCSHKTT